jgi:alpha-amylase/alpha-mannosidase (GH57 family)
MSHVKKLNLILCWHMHQPDYRNYATGEFELPWTYLHALKDYSDMVGHLENQPAARAVFNFVPVLLDQLEDYADQFATDTVRDPLLDLLRVKDMNRITKTQRDLILGFCFRCNHTRMIEPFPAFKRLRDMFVMADGHGEAGLSYLSGQFLADLLVWYHLVWTGETVRREYELVIQLMTKGEGFTAQERRQLFDLIGRVIQGVIPRYRKLAEAGRIEISTTPHYHPIVPLLIDFNSARDAEPQASLPEAPGYPGGLGRATFHVNSAIDSHERRFGAPPQGFWPAEGGISDAFLKLLGERGVGWTASGEGVLAHSLRRARDGLPLPQQASYLYRPYRAAGAAHGVACFFRDDRLSDLIGFEYAGWHGRDAVHNFVQALEHIWQQTPEHEDPVVSVIMDGENAWEYYPYNGYYFLTELYSVLSQHAFIRTTTFKDYLEECGTEPHGRCAATGDLPSLVAGSWVYGTFSTWIGSPDKNRAWDLLCDAKRSFDLVMAGGRLSEAEQAAAHKQLADCESSDWFWWFGDYNPQHSVESFDKLYRENLANLYHLLKLPVPAQLAEPISRGGGVAEAGGTMRRASA